MSEKYPHARPEEQHAILGPDGAPAGTKPVQPVEMIGVPKHKLEEVGRQLAGLAQENQQLQERLLMAHQELAHWRALDAWRFYCGHIIAARAEKIIHQNANERGKSIDAVCSLAEEFLRRDMTRRPKQDAAPDSAGPDEPSDLLAIAGSV